MEDYLDKLRNDVAIRDAKLKNLRERLSDVVVSYDKLIMDYGELVERLNRQIADNMAWIKADERLPNSIAPVLVDTDEFEDTTISNNLYIAVLNGNEWMLRTASGTYFFKTTGTYWRELPMPARQKETK